MIDMFKMGLFCDVCDGFICKDKIKFYLGCYERDQKRCSLLSKGTASGDITKVTFGN